MIIIASLSKQISMQAESVSTTSAAVEEMAASILNVARVADSRQNVTESLMYQTASIATRLMLCLKMVN